MGRKQVICGQNMLPRIYLIRHGEAEWSLSGQHTSRTDIPWTARGADAARELGQRLRDIRFPRVLVTIFIVPCLFCAVEEWKWKQAQRLGGPDERGDYAI